MSNNATANSKLKYALSQWYKIDEEIESLQKEKEKMHRVMISEIQSNKLVGYKFLLPRYDISCISIKEKEHISKKFLTEKLEQYFKGSKIDAGEIVDKIYSQRKETEKVIIRKHKKKMRDNVRLK